MFSNLDTIFTRNEYIINRFKNRIVKILSNTTDDFLKKHQKEILKKDSSVLNSIIKEDLGKTALGGIYAALSELWNLGWKAGENSIKRGSFSLATSSLADFVVPQFTPEEINVVQQRVESQEAANSYIGATISRTNFGESYLRYRNREIGRNFTNTYRDKIYSSVTEYMKSPRRYTNTRDMMLDLGFRAPSELTDEERRAYDSWIRGQRRAGVEVDYPDVYGLSGEVLRDPNRYDSWKFFLRGRIMRIARTETAAAFNLGRLNTFIEQGYTEFTWELGGENECYLCRDKQGDIVTLADLGVVVHSYDNVGWTDYSKIWTEASKTDSGVTRSGRSYDNNTAILPPIHPHCDCRLIPREEGKRGALAVVAEDMLTKASKVASAALKMLGKTTAVSAVGVGATTLAEEYLRQGQYLEQEEKGNILWTILAGTSLLAGGYMTFKLVTSHPQFLKGIKEKAVKLGERLLGSAIESQLESLRTNAQIKLDAAKKNYINEQLREEEEDLPPEERQAYKDFTNLGLAPTLASKLVTELRSATSKGNYHDLVATKLREHMFSMLTPNQINVLANLENIGQQTNFWELNFGAKSEQVKNLTGAMLAHLEMGANTGQSAIALNAPKADIKRFKAFMGASLQDVAVQGRHAFKGKLLNVATADVIDVITDLRIDLGRELDWSVDRAVISKRMKDKFQLGDSGLDALMTDLETTFPNSRSGLPTGNNLVLKAEKLHSISIPSITTKTKILEFQERLTNIKTTNLIDNPSALNNLEADIEAFRKEVKDWGEISSLKPLETLLGDVDAARSIPKRKVSRAKIPVKIPELELVPIAEAAPEQATMAAELTESARQQVNSNLYTYARTAEKYQDALTAKVRQDIGYSKKATFKTINEGTQVNKNRISELVRSNQLIQDVDNELENITRSWSDAYFDLDTPYLETARSSKRSTATNRRLLQLHGKLEQERYRITQLSEQRRDTREKLRNQRAFLQDKIKQAKQKQLKGHFDGNEIEGIIQQYDRSNTRILNYKQRLIQSGFEDYVPEVDKTLKRLQDRRSTITSLDASGVIAEMEQDITDIDNLLRFYDQPNDHQLILDRINSLMDTKLSVVQSARRGKRVVGSNTWFPEKLDGDSLRQAREKRRIYAQQDALRKTVASSRKQQQAEVKRNVSKLQRITDETERELKKHRTYIESDDRLVSQYNNRLLNEFKQKEQISSKLLLDLEEISSQARVAKRQGNTKLVAELEQRFNSISGTARANNAVVESRKQLRAEIRRLEKVRKNQTEFNQEIKNSRDAAIRSMNESINKRMRSVTNSTTISDAEKEKLANILKRIKADNEVQLTDNYRQLTEQHVNSTKEINELIKRLRRQHDNLKNGKLRVTRNEQANVGDKVEVAGEKDLSGKIRRLGRVFKDQTKSTP